MPPENSDYQPNPTTPDEIDLLRLTRTLWEGRRTIFKTLSVFTAIGLLIALFSRKEYTAYTSVVPESTAGQANMAGLSGLASLAGVNLGTGNSFDIPPSLYPQIISSVPFQLELMKTKLNFKDIDHPVSLFDYYNENSGPGLLYNYTLGLPGSIVKTIWGNSGKIQAGADDNNSPIRLTEEQKEVQDILNDLITIDHDNKEGYVSISCRMPEALPAAQLTGRTQYLLQQYITEFKIQKAKANLEFVQSRHDEVQKQYNRALEELARFRDSNKNVTTAIALTELERITNNYNLIYGIYSELAKQLEQAKIQVKEDTPVFTVIEPVSVPLEKSAPRRSMILIIWICLGGIVGTGITFSRKYFPEIRDRWNS